MYNGQVKHGIQGNQREELRIGVCSMTSFLPSFFCFLFCLLYGANLALNQIFKLPQHKLH